MPGEDLGADARGGGRVGRVAAVDEGEAELCVGGRVEGQAAEDEVAAVEAGDWKGGGVWVSKGDLRGGGGLLTVLRGKA